MKLLSLFSLMLLSNLCEGLPTDADGNAPNKRPCWRRASGSGDVLAVKTSTQATSENNDLDTEGGGSVEAEVGELDAALGNFLQLAVLNDKTMSQKINSMNKKIDTVENQYEKQNDIVESLSNETSKQEKALAVHDTELSDIQSLLENQNETDDEMKKKLTDEDEEITRLKKVIEKQGQDILNQAEIIREQKEKVSSLDKKISRIETTLSNNTNQISKIAPEITELKAIQDSQNRVNARQDEQINKLNIRVYFSAYSTQGGITVEKGQTLVLGSTHVNIGENYDPSTGIFTCVTPGTYEFMIKASSDAGYSIHLGIYKNNNVQASLRSKVKDYFTDASTSAIVSLKKNDKVQVKGEWDTSEIHARGGGKLYAHFSGKLLSAD